MFVDPFIVSDPFAEIVTVLAVLLIMIYCSPLCGEAGRLNVIALVATRYRPAWSALVTVRLLLNVLICPAFAATPAAGVSPCALGSEPIDRKSVCESYLSAEIMRYPSALPEVTSVVSHLILA